MRVGASVLNGRPGRVLPGEAGAREAERPDSRTKGPASARLPGRPSARDSARIRQMVREAGLWSPLALAGGLLGLALLTVPLHWQSPGQAWPPGLCLVALTAAVGALALAWQRLKTRLLVPLVHLEESVALINQGEPGASRSLQDAGVLERLAGDIGSLNAELTELYEEMDHRVARQTRRLAQKTASLKILYGVAAAIQQSDSLDALLLRFLRELKEMVNGRAGTLRLVMPDGSERLVGSIGLDSDQVQPPDLSPVDLCLCGNVLGPGHIVCDQAAHYCSRVYGHRMLAADAVEEIQVPLEHRGERLGVYSLFVDKPGIRGREDIRDLLLTVGHHLGMAVAKVRSDAEACRLSILEERNALAHELHDSLAQTLASLRYQMSMLHDGLAPCDIPPAVRTDLARVRSGLDEAHTELRELLTSFRAPLDRRGLVPALDQLTRRLGRETGAHVLFQNDCRSFELAASQELQILRIVQEALANVRKHARAQTVRVLLRRQPDGAYVLLVEDDGRGFRTPRPEERPGEHLGLTIMAERARRIGADLRIESEPGEGTRVELVWSPARRGGGSPGEVR